MFVLLTKLTGACKEKLRDEPEILEDICSKLESYDQSGLPQLATLGQYNFINIIDVEEEKTAYRLALELNSRGDVETTVLPALLMKDYLGEVRKMKD
ncbi:MAG: GYD domain-containing protein [Deltaproteobacteria bacterium]|nr:GYD domain-containing protein [Deltaproteobacteria bacterium]